MGADEGNQLAVMGRCRMVHACIAGSSSYYGVEIKQN